LPERKESESRKLLGRLRDTLAESGAGQERLDRITTIIADSMGTEVCSIYLFRDAETLELCATEGCFMPETGEEIYSSFLGLPIQRLGETLGVLVVQSKAARTFTDDEVYALEVVAMVIAEMTELGAFLDEGSAMGARHTQQALFRGGSAQEGAAEGHVFLHEPRVVITNPIADDPHAELARLQEAMDTLRSSVDEMLGAMGRGADKEQVKVLEAYRMFANSRSWVRRMEEDISLGLSAEAAVEKEQSATRARMEQVPDPYLRERLHDLDDLSNRLLRLLTGQGRDTGAAIPDNPILVARNIGPGELLDYGKKLRGIVLEEGSVGSHAAIVARAWAIPLVINAKRILTEALNGDHILVDGDQGVVHLRPEDTVATAFRDKCSTRPMGGWSTSAPWTSDRTRCCPT